MEVFLFGNLEQLYLSLSSDQDIIFGANWARVQAFIVPERIRFINASLDQAKARGLFQDLGSGCLGTLSYLLQAFLQAQAFGLEPASVPTLLDTDSYQL